MPNFFKLVGVCQSGINARPTCLVFRLPWMPSEKPKWQPENGKPDFQAAFGLNCFITALTIRTRSATLSIMAVTRNLSAPAMR